MIDGWMDGQENRRLKEIYLTGRVFQSVHAGECHAGNQKHRLV